MLRLVDLLWCACVCGEIFHLYGEVTIAVEGSQVKMNCCYLADSSYLSVLWQFLSSPISPFMQIHHLHKGIPMAVNSISKKRHLINIHENCREHCFIWILKLLGTAVTSQICYGMFPYMVLSTQTSSCSRQNNKKKISTKAISNRHVYNYPSRRCYQ